MLLCGLTIQCTRSQLRRAIFCGVATLRWPGDWGVSRPLIKLLLLRKTLCAGFNQGLFDVALRLHLHISEIISYDRSFLKAGKIQYLRDCSHALAGKTVDMVPVDDI